MILELTYNRRIPIAVGDSVPVENRWGFTEEAMVLSVSFQHPESEPVALGEDMNRVFTDAGKTLVIAEVPNIFRSRP